MLDANTTERIKYERQQEICHEVNQARLEEHRGTVFMEYLDGHFDQDLADYIQQDADMTVIAGLLRELVHGVKPINGSALDAFHEVVQELCTDIARARL